MSRRGRANRLMRSAALAVGLAAAIWCPPSVASPPDPTFGDGGQAEVPGFSAAGYRDIARAGASIYVASAGGVVARLDASGDLDPTYGVGGYARIVSPRLSALGYPRAEGIAVQSDGKLLVAGGYGQQVTGRGTVYRPVLTRLRPDGSFDPTFSGDGVVIRAGDSPPARSTFFTGIGTDADGRIVVSGLAGLRSTFLQRHRPGGGIDRTYGRRGRISFRHRRGEHWLGGVAVTRVGRTFAVETGPFGTRVLSVAASGRRDRSFARGKGVFRLPSGLTINPAAEFTPTGDLAIFAKIIDPRRSTYRSESIPVVALLSRRGLPRRSFGRRGVRRLSARVYEAAFPGLGSRVFSVTQQGFAADSAGRILVSTQIPGRRSLTVRLGRCGAIDRSFAAGGAFVTGDAATESGWLPIEADQVGTLVTAGTSPPSGRAVIYHFSASP